MQTTRFLGWLKNQDGKTIIKIMKTFRWHPPWWPRCKWNQGTKWWDCWWSGDRKNEMTKGVKVTISSNYLVNKPLPEMHLSGSWRKYMHLSGAQSNSCLLFCFLPRLLCVDWPGSVLKASRTLTSSNWSSPGLWTLSYSAATWRRVLCSKCERGKAFGSILLPLWVHTCEHTWVHTSPLTSLFILNLFFTWSGHRAKYSSNIIRQSVFLESLFVFIFWLLWLFSCRCWNA